MKLFLRLVFVGIALLAVVVLIGFASIGKVAVAAVEEGGTYALGVPTSLGSARIGLFSGELDLSEALDVANPKGFGREHFLHVGQAQLAVSLGSLRSQRVEAPLLLFEGVEVSLERREGRTNYATILANLERLQGAPQEKQEGDEPEQVFVIREIVLRDIVAYVDLLPAGGEWTKTSIRLPELKLENVGNESGSVADVIGQVVTALLAAVAREGGGVLPDDLLEDLQGDLAGLTESALELGDEALSEIEKEAGKQLGEGLEGLLKRD